MRRPLILAGVLIASAGFAAVAVGQSGGKPPGGKSPAGGRTPARQASHGSSEESPARSPIEAFEESSSLGVISLIDEAEVPAEEAGLLVELKVKKGQFVQAGELLATLDDEEAKERVNAAKFELDAATEQAENDVRVRAAKASASVAKAEEDVYKLIKGDAPGAVTDAEIRKLELATLHADLQIELADHELSVAKITKYSKESQHAAAKILLDHRHIVAPIDGMVVETMRHKGEWLTAGQPLLRIVRMDRLEIESVVNSEEYLPEEVFGRPVEVKVHLKRGRDLPLNGVVTFVSPIVDDTHAFRITVELNNFKINGNWVLRPGLDADVKIDAVEADVSGLKEAAELSAPKQPMVGAAETPADR